ncbi:helicase [Capsaspora owczarzaki ATCC 30864]|uniref:DNA replication ATP-dependent helicase/nuclease DNA2 n=1 Tax=Capsaspora owczarzaki (strain ATCC 30864) TaxID=595528 RepID=A0A0D2VGN8_CAPO3|nr:helicase [Capsaspora owczarzaki ATCC 30864]
MHRAADKPETTDSILQAAAANMPPTVLATTPAPKHPRLARVLRFNITYAQKGTVVVTTSDKNTTVQRPELTVFATRANDGVQCILRLRDNWIYTPVAPNHVCNLVSTAPYPTDDPGDFGNDGVYRPLGGAPMGDMLSLDVHEYVIDASPASALLVLQPDCLVTGTRVAESVFCKRRGVLNERLRGPTDYSAPALLYGSMLHELFEIALAAGTFTAEFITQQVARVLSQFIEELYGVGDDEKAATVKLCDSIPAIQEWAQRFYKSEPGGAESDVPYNDAPGNAQINHTHRVAISAVVDIEENLVSPAYGLKGKVDATLEVVTESALTTRHIVPFELKTGKASGTSAISHSTQVTLYTLLMSDRYEKNITSGLLYYLKSGTMQGITHTAADLRGIMIARNELAVHLSGPRFYPEMLKSPRQCKSCFQLDNCMIIHKALEHGNAESAGLDEGVFEAKTQHLNVHEIAYLQHWMELIALETGDDMATRHELWTMSSEARESRGRCLGSMVVVSARPPTACTPVRAAARRQFRQSMSPSLLDTSFNVNDPVMISLNDGSQVGLSTGSVREITPDYLVVVVARQLQARRSRASGLHSSAASYLFAASNPGGTQVSKCIPRLIKPSMLSEPAQNMNAELFRLDKEEMSVGTGLTRDNLASLFVASANARRRALIVELAAPTFDEPSVAVAAVPTDANAAAASNLNVDQLRAIDLVQRCRDYALILGMPGSGKTTTIAELVRRLVAQGLSVLLCAYTHTAVDNILLKMDDTMKGVEFVRLGNSDRVHPKLAHRTAQHAPGAQTVAGIEQLYTQTPVVAATCLGINHPLFTRRRFDVCIIDEASQVTLPVCLGPLRYADRFVLVGDHYQLTPLVRNPTARQKGMAESLFERLSNAHPAAVVYLEHQYRMNRDIMLLSNTLIYQHRLKCGSAAVGAASLDLPRLPELARALSGKRLVDSGTHWLLDAIDPARKVVFLDTDLVPALEVRVGEVLKNDTEASIVQQLMAALLEAGLAPNDVGVISPYRSQLKAIRHLINSVQRGVEMHTVDKYQGRDKECIIVSLVRSNAEKNLGDLLNDWRRVNVAFTRAKKKLIIVGSRSTIEQSPLLASFVELLLVQQWIITLPKGAHSMFEMQPIATPQRNLFYQTVSNPIVLTTPQRLAAAERRRVAESTASPDGPRKRVRRRL